MGVPMSNARAYPSANKCQRIPGEAKNPLIHFAPLGEGIENVGFCSTPRFLSGEGSSFAQVALETAQTTRDDTDTDQRQEEPVKFLEDAIVHGF